jgi:hypothetical protein
MNDQTPDFRIEIPIVPSVNDYLAIARHAGASQGMVKLWRKRGRELAIWTARRAGHNIRIQIYYETTERGRVLERVIETIDPLIFTSPVKLIVKFWRPTRRSYDCFNPFIKPIIDGFVDAGVIADDNFEHIPSVEIRFMGIDKSLKLSPEALERRRIARIGRKPKREPVPCRFYFDFFKI